MKHSRIIVLLFFTLSIFHQPLTAGWKQSLRPCDGDVSSIVSVSGYVFAGTRTSGIFRSGDNGATWNAVNTGLSDTMITSLAVSGTTLFAGTYHTGVFRSTDSGGHWYRAGGSPDIVISVSVMAVIDTVLYAGTLGTGIYSYSLDGSGCSAINAGLSQYTVTNVTAIVGSGGILYAALNSSGLFRSIDAGMHWTPTAKATIYAIQSLAVTETTLYAGTYNFGVFVSTDRGESWTDTGLKAPRVGSLQIVGRFLLAGCDSGVYRSTLAPMVWNAVNSGLTWRSVNTIASANGRVYAGTRYGGMYVSLDSASSWKGAGVANTAIFSLAILGAHIFAGSYGGAVFHSRDEGESWEQMNRETMFSSVNALAVRDSSVFAGTVAGGIYRSPIAGTQWTAMNNGLADLSVHAIGFSGLNMIVGTEHTGIWISQDGGAHWSLSSTGLSDTSVTAFFDTGTSLYAGTHNRGVCRSIDHGATWSSANQGLGWASVTSFGSIGRTLFTGVENRGIFYSLDSAASWMPTDVTNMSIYGIAVTGRHLFVGANVSGVYRSIDNGLHWSQNGLPSYWIMALGISATQLFAGTVEGSVFRRSLSEITPVKQEAADHPAACSLEQNYPNPFNPSTMIRYSLSATSAVRLSIYDLLGRRVEELDLGMRTRGSHTSIVDLSQHPSGVYMYRLEAISETGKRWELTQRMLMLR